MGACLISRMQAGKTGVVVVLFVLYHIGFILAIDINFSKFLYLFCASSWSSCPRVLDIDHDDQQKCQILEIKMRSEKGRNKMFKNNPFHDDERVIMKRWYIVSNHGKTWRSLIKACFDGLQLTYLYIMKSKGVKFNGPKSKGKCRCLTYGSCRYV